MACPLCQTLAQIRAGAFARHVCSLEHCEVILHDNQVCAGWCVLIYREHAEHAAELAPDVERAVFAEAARVGRAVREVFPQSGARIDGRVAPPRINYANLGNVVGHIHWHVVPRHGDDPDPRAVPWNLATATATDEAIESLRIALARMI